jgi:hypothetical protein
MYKINRFSYNRNTAFTFFNFCLDNKEYNIKFFSNPILEQNLLELHLKPKEQFIETLNKYVKTQDFGYSTTLKLKKILDDYNK